jgi:hypothetical protein
MATGRVDSATDLGRRIRRQRRAAGLTRDEAADRACMAPSYLAYLETNPEASPTPAALARLASALDTSTEGLAGAGVDRPPGQEPAGSYPRLESLSPTECQDFLGSGGVGRFLYDSENGPVAIPVNYKMLRDDIVFRVAAAGVPSRLSRMRRVAFEVDHLDEVNSTGWSVLASGKAHAVTDGDELREVTSLRITPWAGGDRDTYLRLEPAEVTGRKIMVG